MDTLRPSADCHSPRHTGGHRISASPADAQAARGHAWSTNLQFASLGFRKVRPSRCTSFTPSFRSRVWLLSGSLQLSKHWRTGAAAGKNTAAQSAGRAAFV